LCCVDDALMLYSCCIDVALWCIDVALCCIV
jgi:hypothetical protein